MCFIQIKIKLTQKGQALDQKCSHSTKQTEQQKQESFEEGRAVQPRSA